MHILDWGIVAGYLALTLYIGAYLSRRATRSIEDFFVSGRSLPWWLAGISMAATTFSIDAPLYIAGVVGSRGIAGNWEWWAFGFGHIVMVYVFARLWRRSEVVTDAELTELRYGGTAAAWLRGTKAFVFAVPLNCIGMGYAMLAAVKIVGTLGIWEGLGLVEGSTVMGVDPKLLTVLGISVLVLVYASFAGLWGVVATDFFQYFLALFGAIALAVYALQDPRVGGLAGLVERAQLATPDFNVLAFVPLTFEDGSWWRVGWSAAAGISATTFLGYVFLQWWTFRRSDGGGEFIQRLISAKNEHDAEKAAWLFNMMHYVVRTWPWIIVALAAVIIYPVLDDRELGYPMLMLELLPIGMLGLVVASLLAAFMSTVSTQINWGASYLVQDIYRRFLRPEASQKELVRMGMAASVLITTLGGTAAFFFEDIRVVFRLVVAMGTGPGVVLILRWFWWRINAPAELAAMLAGLLIGSVTSIYPGLVIEDFGIRLVVITGVTTLLWVAAMLLTSPESPEVLEAFYRRIQPPGPGWRSVRAAMGVVEEAPALRLPLYQSAAGIVGLFGLMFGIGSLLLLQWWTGIVLCTIAAGAFWGLKQLRASR